MNTLRIALLHLAPVPGDLEHNRRLVERAVTTAAGLGAAWAITPELVICGYQFADRIGTDWILPQPDAWMAQLGQLAAQLQVTVFLSHPERDSQTGQLYNSVFVIGAHGALAGKHRKLNVIPGSESWSSPGQQLAPIAVPPLMVGILICSDAYTLDNARRLKAQGAQLLVSPAAWAPGLHGPDGEWEQCTRETGLPLLVCNRTGPDRTLDFAEAESVVVQDGRRLLSFRSPRSALVSVDWDLETQTLVKEGHRIVYL